MTSIIRKGFERNSLKTKTNDFFIFFVMEDPQAIQALGSTLNYVVLNSISETAEPTNATRIQHSQGIFRDTANTNNVGIRIGRFFIKGIHESWY